MIVLLWGSIAPVSLRSKEASVPLVLRRRRKGGRDKSVCEISLPLSTWLPLSPVASASASAAGAWIPVVHTKAPAEGHEEETPFFPPGPRDMKKRA